VINETEFFQYVYGSCATVQDIENSFGLTEDETLDILIKLDLVLCETCDWWTDGADLWETVNSDMVCTQCYDESDEQNTL
jgi:hypothetical protein